MWGHRSIPPISLINAHRSATWLALTYASHSDGPFNYSAGVFYIDGWGGWTPLGLRTSSLTANIVSKQNYTSYAAFGEIYFDLTDRLSIIAGARYSHEKRDQLTAFDMTLDPDVTLTSIGKKSWNSFTPRALIKYDVTDTSNVYLSFSQGFKSGVFNTTAFSPVQADGTQPLAEPEKLYAYELGYKGRVADWLNLNAAVFYNDYKKLQQLFLVAGAGGLAQGVYGNAGGASIYGAEFDANMRFGRHFDARVGVSVLDTKYKGFENITISSPITDANGVPLNTGNVDTLYDATGNTMIKAPKFTSYLTATYHADFANGILDLTGTVFHSSASAYTFDHRIVQKAYETADVRLAWTPDTDAFTIAGYVRNLTNEDVITGTYAQVAGDGISYAPPRTWGIQLDLRF